MSSKLPDEIKRLMIEHPIAQAQQQGGGATLSDDLIERASRLMKNENSNNYIPESVKPKAQQQTQTQNQKQFVIKYGSGSEYPQLRCTVGYNTVYPTWYDEKEYMKGIKK
jgi:hypothetical protein